MKYKQGEKLEIWWIDSCHLSGWRKIEDLDFDKRDLEHQSIGYLIKETNYSIAIIQSRSIDGITCDALMEIPKCAIHKIKKLK